MQNLELIAACALLALVVCFAVPGMWWALLTELVGWAFE